jgi:hypothetical protein
VLIQFTCIHLAQVAFTFFLLRSAIELHFVGFTLEGFELSITSGFATETCELLVDDNNFMIIVKKREKSHVALIYN